MTAAMPRRTVTAGAALLALALFAGCASVPPREGLSAAPPAWLAAPATWRIRQVVLIEFGEAKFAIQGLMELDAAAGRIRLAALDDFGVTLFRLTIDGEGNRVDFLLPLVPRGEDVTRSVAASLRRIYLDPAAATFGGEALWLEAGPAGAVTTAGPRAGESWKVWYDDYENEGRVSVPRTIRYRERGGASLTIRQESVKRVEQ